MNQLCAYPPCKCLVPVDDLYCDDVCAMLAGNVVRTVNVSTDVQVILTLKREPGEAPESFPEEPINLIKMIFRSKNGSVAPPGSTTECGATNEWARRESGTCSARKSSRPDRAADGQTVRIGVTEKARDTLRRMQSSWTLDLRLHS